LSDPRHRVRYEGWREALPRHARQRQLVYLAGLWEPGDGAEVYFRIVTVYANSDIVDYQQRHGAIIHRRQVYDWLDGLVPTTELLCTPPAHTFHVERVGGRKPRRQGELSL
jgi:putative SOS response-associated peptidase YedK